MVAHELERHRVRNGPRLGGDRGAPYEVRLRLAVRCATQAQAERVGQEVEALYLNGPAGGAPQAR